MKSEIVFIIILILATVIGAYFIGASLKEEEYTGGFNTYVVMPGETLWSIAGDIQSETQSDADIREIVYTIKQDNEMNDSIIYAWQELQLRTSY